MRTSTTKEFIVKAKSVHGETYNYSLSHYVNAKTKTKIICESHGVFLQAPYHHLEGRGCKKCGTERTRSLTTFSKEIFIKKAERIHGDKYDYSLVDYVNSMTKIKIICNTCGLVFEQKPTSHINIKQGCLNCSRAKRIDTKNDFIKKAKKRHGDRYEYNNVIYKNSKTNIRINCKKHGEFLQTPNMHTRGEGCPKCAVDTQASKMSLGREVFILKSRKIHGEKYNYSLVDYRQNKKHVIIICDTHGEFEQLPCNHMKGFGCYKCGQSYGEAKISDTLTKWNVNFIKEKTFNGCENPETKYKLRFDFYIPERNLIIEFDGLQHFFAVKHFGGKEGFKQRLQRDRFKNNWCKDNSVNLVRIPYTKFKQIETILSGLLNT